MIWSEDRSQTLRRLVREGKSDRDIAAALGCTPPAVRARRRLLDLPANAPTRDMARAENEQPWDPPTGMVKRRCARCRYWFSAPSELILMCRECVE